MHDKTEISKKWLPNHRFSGLLLKLAAVVLVVIGSGLLLSRLGVVVSFLGGMIIFSSAALYSHGKKLAAPTAQEALSRDARPPVLYLRSFLADETASAEREGLLPISVFGAQFDKTEEEILATVLSKVGPGIAIGQPGEKLPPLGMARMYVEDGQEWRRTVQDLMLRSGAVVIRVGDTENIWWEMEAAVKSVRPERLLFLLPFEPDEGRSNLLGLAESSPDGYERFRRRLEKHIPCQLPSFSASSRASRVAECSFDGLLFFDPDWTPHVMAFDDNNLHLSTKGLLKKAFSPFIAGLKKKVDINP